MGFERSEEAMGISCEEVRRDISDYIDGDLDPIQRHVLAIVPRGPQEIVTGAHRDARHPMLEWRFAAKALQLLIRLHENLLADVVEFGVARRIDFQI